MRSNEYVAGLVKRRGWPKLCWIGELDTKNSWKWKQKLKRSRNFLKKLTGKMTFCFYNNHLCAEYILMIAWYSWSQLTEYHSRNSQRRWGEAKKTSPPSHSQTRKAKIMSTTLGKAQVWALLCLSSSNMFSSFIVYGN